MNNTVIVNGDEFRAARAAARLTQKELAKRAKVSPYFVMNAERPNGVARGSLEVLGKLAHALGRPFTDFIVEPDLALAGKKARASK